MLNQLVKNKVKPWWKSKIAFLFSMAYFQFLIVDVSFEKAGIFLVLFLLSAIFTGVFAHLLNDWTDVKEDALASKFNSVTKLGRQKSTIFLILSLVLAVIPWFFYENHGSIFYLLGFEFFLFSVYSLRFIRLKEKNVWGVITDSLYAYVVFSCIALSVGFELPLDITTFFLYLTLIFWIFLVGVQHIIIHQFTDYENDLKTDTKTWLTTVGKERARIVLFNFIFPFQLLFFILALVFLAYKLQNLYCFILPILLIGLKLYRFFSLKSLNYFEDAEEQITPKMFADFDWEKAKSFIVSELNKLLNNL